MGAQGMAMQSGPRGKGHLIGASKFLRKARRSSIIWQAKEQDDDAVAD